MTKKRFLLTIFMIQFLAFLHSEESWIIPMESSYYRLAEELFINEWRIPQFDESPIIADDLRNQVKSLLSDTVTQDTIMGGQTILQDLKLPFEHISPIVETAFFTAYNSESGRLRTIDTNDPSLPYPIIDFTYFYDINKIPPLLTAGFTAQAAGFSLVFEPFLQSSHSYLLDYQYMLNFPLDIIRINNNIPERGIAAFYAPPFELRFGRDKLNLGPGKWSTLTVSKNVPYFDYLKARFFVDWMSYSFHLIQLNPTISTDESIALPNLYKREINWPMNGEPFIERSKYLAIARLILTPLPWFSLTIMQTNLIAGRYPWISDLNPFSIYHNNFTEGVYSVPIDVSLSVVPYKGIKLYFEFLLYDASVADETDPTINPSAFAFQAGLTVLSSPFFQIGSGRFRLDTELSLIDPWTYGKYYDLRKFTTRIIYVESFIGRMWVDYPLGYYLGPDVIDLNMALAYGVPGDWEFELHWNFTGKGEIDLYGWGDNSDYAKFPSTRTPYGNAEWRNDIEVSFYFLPADKVKLKTWYRFRSVVNQFNIPYNTNFYNYCGVETTWKIY